MSQAEREATVVARSAAHTVFLLPHDDGVVPQFLGAALERVAPEDGALHGLILTPDTETALAIARASRLGGVHVIPLTSAGRAARLLRAGGTPPVAVAATPGVIAALMRTASIPLSEVRVLVLAWADEMIDQREGGALETVLADVPKESARTLVTAVVTPEVDALIERYLRRPRRVESKVPALETTLPLLRHVEATRASRPVVLRRLLDELDPASTAIIVQTDASETEVRETLHLLGYGEDDASMQIVRDTPTSAATALLFYDLPGSAESLTAAAALSPTQLLVFVSPRQLPALRHMAGGDVPPFALSPALIKARAFNERVRVMLRAELASGLPAREILAIEPLLDEFDGVELAAAALRVLERERSALRAAPPPARPAATVATVATVVPTVAASSAVAPAPAPAPAPTTPVRADSMTRVFFSIGERDGARAADLVGAIANEAGITHNEIGKVAVRESHAIVEIATSVSASVIEKMTGVVVRGRRLVARVDAGTDRERPAGRPSFGGGGARGREGSGGRSGGSGGRDAGRRGPGARRDDRGGARGASRDGPRGPSRDGARGPSRDGARGPARDGARGPARDGARGPARGSARGPARGGARGPARDSARGPARDSARGPARDSARGPAREGARGPAGDAARGGRAPRLMREHNEWAERGERVRNARRGPEGDR